MKISSQQKTAVKERLLKEAARQFSEKGLDGASINDIATGAGYAKGTIYNYFRSKEELFGEVIAAAAGLSAERYRSAPHHSTARESLIEIARADVSVLREEEPFMKVLVGEAMNPGSDKYELIMAHLGEFTGIIDRIIEEGLKRGEIRDDKPTIQLSLIFLGILTLFYIQYWNSGGAWPALEEIPELSVSVFLDGAGRKDSTSGLGPGE